MVCAKQFLQGIAFQFGGKLKREPIIVIVATILQSSLDPKRLAAKDELQHNHRVRWRGSF
jgi:hypothetical protein